MYTKASRERVVRAGDPETVCAIGMALLAPAAAMEIERLRQENAGLKARLAAERARSRFLERAYRQSVRRHTRRTREWYAAGSSYKWVDDLAMVFPFIALAVGIAVVYAIVFAMG